MDEKPLVFRVKPGAHVTLNDYDTRYRADISRKEAEKRYPDLMAEFVELQRMLCASQTHSLLVVLQGMDTSGKDGTIRHVFGPINPQGCKVTSFKVPSKEELAHDFLWRVHRVTPRRGEIGIFNRSHYGDVLVVRVHNLVPRDVWKLRYETINDFERLLARNNTLIVKIFLHISKEEQEERLLSREEDELKTWKLSTADWTERAYWDEYQRAYEAALGKCSTDYAPWYIVPADRKWFRNYAVLSTMLETLRPLREGWLHDLKARGANALAEVQALRNE